MEFKSQPKNTLVDIIEHELNKRHWKPIDLARYSGVKQPVISRLMNGGINIKVVSIYKILITLNLLKSDQQNNFMCGWSEDAIRACNDLKEVLDFGEKEEKEDVLLAIKRFKKFRDLKKPVAGLSSERRKKSTIVR